MLQGIGRLDPLLRIEREAVFQEINEVVQLS